MAKFGLFHSGATAPSLEYEGDHIDYLGLDIVVIRDAGNNTEAIIRLNTGQCVKKITR